MKLNLNPKMQLLECNYIMQVRLFVYIHYLGCRCPSPVPPRSLEASEIENSCNP